MDNGTDTSPTPPAPKTIQERRDELVKAFQDMTLRLEQLRGAIAILNELIEEAQHG